MNFIRQRPWLWIVAVFIVLIAVWTGFITIAVKNQPAQVPVHTAAQAAQQ